MSSDDIIKQRMQDKLERMGEDSLMLTPNSIDFDVIGEREQPSTERKVVRFKELKKDLEEYVVGNQELVRHLSAIGILYLKYLEQVNNGVSPENLPQLSLFVTGPTGTGKSHSIHYLAKLLDLNYYRIDCTKLVASGNMEGKNIESTLKRWSKPYTGGGILFLDEMDKLSLNKQSNNYSWYHGIQSELLDVVSGVLPGYDRLLIIAAGSFEDVRQDHSNASGAIGFTQEPGYISPLEQKKELLRKGGMIPELVGRFLDVVSTEKITKELVISLINKKSSVYAKYQKILKGFFLNKEDIEEIAERVLDKRNTSGLRELDTLLYNKVLEKYYV